MNEDPAAVKKWSGPLRGGASGRGGGVMDEDPAAMKKRPGPLRGGVMNEGEGAKPARAAPGPRPPTVGASRVREIVEQESARILGPMGVALAQQAWARRRPRGMADLLALLREIGAEMEDPELAKRYVERTSQRVSEAARAE